MTDPLQQHLAAALGDGYRIERELGGGMARVFLAHEVGLDRRVVVKVFEGQHDRTAVARFLREIQFVAALQHPQIVGVLSAGEVDGVPWYIMPFVDGASVRERLADGPLSVRETVAILRDVGRALAYAHERGIVHRDLKPDNILLAGGSAVLTDFGVAKATGVERDAPKRGEAITQVGFTVGTPAYMAPEQITGDVLDGRTDLYALGMTAYEMLSGRAPFAGREAPAMLMAHVSELPADLAAARPDLPAGLARLVMQMIEKDPARRPASVAVVLEALDDPAVTSGVITPGTLRTAVGASRASGSKRLLLGAAAALVLLALGAGGFAALKGRGGVTPSVAVLPLATAGAAGSDALVVDGIADELALALSRLPGVRVAPRAATAGLSAELGAQEIGRRLNVTTVMFGSGQLVDGRLRLSLQLVDASAGTLLWGERFDGRMSDVFGMQDSVAKAVASAFAARFGSAPGAAPAPGGWGTTDATAYEDFLRGRVLFQRRRTADLLASIEALKRATARDTAFARAWAALADVYSVLPTYGVMRGDSATSLAVAAVDRALALDPRLASALAARGNLRARAGRWNDAERDLAAAMASDTTLPDGYQWLGEVRLLTGHPDSAALLFQRASRLDPTNAIAPSLAALALGAAGRTAEALAWADTGTARDSSFIVPPLFRGMVLVYAGRAAEALPVLRRAAETGDPRHFVDGVLVHALAAAGRTDEAREMLRRLESRSREPGAAAALFRGYVGLGETAQAMDWLERAWLEQDPMFFSEPLYTPNYASVQREPRFVAVMQRAGLTPR